VSMTDKDMEDSQIVAPEVKSMDQDLFGPFDVDACVDEYRTNSYCNKVLEQERQLREAAMGGLERFLQRAFLNALRDSATRCAMQESTPSRHSSNLYRALLAYGGVL